MITRDPTTNDKIQSYGDQIRNTPDGGITRTVSGQFDPPDNSGEWVFDAAGYSAAVSNNRTGRGGPDPKTFWHKKPTAGSGSVSIDPFGRQIPTASAASPQQTQANANAGTSGLSAVAPTYTTYVTIGGRTTPITTASKNDADALLSALEAAHAAGGG